VELGHKKIEMKKDKLEQYISGRREDFNDLNPPALVWKNIDKEVNRVKRIPGRTFISFAWQSAAAVIIFVGSWLLHDYINQGRSSKPKPVETIVAVNPVLNELSDAEAFYSSQISSKQVELSKYTQEHPEIIADLKKEFQEMDKNNTELKKDLVESNANEKVIEAIIKSYRMKLDILDQMLTEMKIRENERDSHRSGSIRL
jgi:hypothetical protein